MKIQFAVTGSIFVPDDHFLERDPQRLGSAIKRVLENAVRNKIEWQNNTKDVSANITVTKDINATVTVTPSMPNET